MMTFVMDFLIAFDPSASSLGLAMLLLLGVTITSATIKHTATVVEALAGAGVASGKGNITYDNYDSTYALTPSTTPKALTNAQFLMALVSGAKTLDLTALIDGSTGQVVDGTGNRVVGFRFKNLGANSMTIVGGASNGYLLFGTAGKVIVPAGGEVSFYTAGVTVPAIDATNKTLDITGTATQTAQVTVITG